MDGYDENAVYSITFEMSGDYSEQITKSGTVKELQSQSFSFTNLLVGSKVKFRCTLYYHDGTPGGKAIWSGESDEVVIAEGANNVSIVMKRMFDKIDRFDMAAFIADLEANYSESVTIAFENGKKVIKDCTLEKYAVPYGYKTIIANDGGAGSIFGECRNLKSVILPDSMEEIGSNAFTSCEKLESIYIPETVTVIESGAFSYCTSLESIEIPDGVTAIGEAAFSGCASLKTINLPKNSSFNTISKRMFQNSGISNIVIPESVTSIGDYAFYDCMGLSTVTLQSRPKNDSDVISIGASVFKYTTSAAREEVIPNLKIFVPYGSVMTSNNTPKQYYTFYKYAYSTPWNDDYEKIIHTPFTSADYARAENAGTREYYTVPDGYTMISENAFAYRANLKGVTIPAEVESIEANAFIDCDNLVSIALKSNTKIAMPVRPLSIDPDTAPDIFNGGNESVRFYVSDSLANDYETDYTQTRFHYNFVSNILTKDTIDNAATNGLIPNFDPAISDICDIPYGYTAIDDASYSGDSVFQACKDTLTTVKFPETMETIGNYAFYECAALGNITIPGNVQTIGRYAFYGCNGLKTIEMKYGVETIGEHAFEPKYPYNTLVIKEIKIPKSVTAIGEYAFTSLQSSAGFDVIFTGDTPVTSMTIGNYAFQSAKGLKSINLPDNLTSIGAYAFQSCDKLSSITIPGSVVSIGDPTRNQGAFEGCSGLETIIIGYGVEEIGYGAFQCYSDNKVITSITIPKSVNKIGQLAFRNMKNPDGFTVTFTDGDKNAKEMIIDDYAFEDSNGLQTIKNFPDNVTSIGKWAFINVPIFRGKS